MNTLTLEMEISKDFLYTFDFKQDQVGDELKLLASIELYREHKVSMGKAAEFAGITKYIFMQELASREIPLIEYDIDEVIGEAEVLKNIRESKK